MNAKKIVRACLLVCGLLAGAAHAETFEVTHVPKGSTGPGIKIVFDGVRYASARTIVLTGAAGGSPVDDAVARIVHIQRQGTPKELATVWEQKVRANLIQTYSANKPAWDQMQQDMRTVTAVKLKAVVRYGAVTLALCDLIYPGSVLPKIYPLKSESGKLVLTNELSDDLVYGQLLILLDRK